MEFRFEPAATKFSNSPVVAPYWAIENRFSMQLSCQHLFLIRAFPKLPIATFPQFASGRRKQ